MVSDHLSENRKPKFYIQIFENEEYKNMKKFKLIPLNSHTMQNFVK